MIQIFSYFLSLFWIFPIVTPRLCSMRPTPVMNNYKEKFDAPIDMNNLVDVTCNDTLTWDQEMKPLKFTAKNIIDGELCRIWLPGGIQLQFISSGLTNSNAGVILREGCRKRLIFRSKLLRNFNYAPSPIIRKDFGAMDFCSFAENDVLIFRFKDAFPLNFFGTYEYLQRHVDD